MKKLLLSALLLGCATAAFAEYPWNVQTGFMNNVYTAAKSTSSVILSSTTLPSKITDIKVRCSGAGYTVISSSWQLQGSDAIYVYPDAGNIWYTQHFDPPAVVSGTARKIKLDLTGGVTAFYVIQGVQ